MNTENTDSVVQEWDELCEQGIRETESINTDQEPQSWVYFLLDPKTNKIKIGVSRQILDRMLYLNSAYHTKLVFLGCFRGRKRTEKATHKTFFIHYDEHEWFFSHQNILDFVAAKCRHDIPWQFEDCSFSSEKVRVSATKRHQQEMLERGY